MTRREAFLTGLVIFAAGLAVRLWAASEIVFPLPEDTAYYTGVARNLLEGRGLVSDSLWSYQTPPLSLPRPAFEVWLPLPTFLATGTMAAFGATFDAAQVPSVLLGGLACVLAWLVARDVAGELGLPTGRSRVMAIGVGLTCAVYLPLVLHGALPDSTTPFTVFALGSCMLMARLVHDRAAVRAFDPRLLVLGALIGLAALTRNEAVWLATTWVVVVLAARPGWRRALMLVLVPGVIAFAVFLPWMVRDWTVFGSPLPGQAAANALSVTGFDIFAWSDPPTLERYLAQGLGPLLGARVTGILHNLVNVLVLLGIPLSILGLIALPWTARGRMLRPLVVLSLTTFLVTSLAFPVATTWGTFLHAAGPVHTLVVISALVILDRGVAKLAGRLEWSRPVAWLGPAFAIFVSSAFTFLYIPAFGEQSQEVGQRYAAIAAQFESIGQPVDELGPVITNFPIWWSEAYRTPALALPNESPTSIVDLASAFPGTRYLVLVGEEHGRWPAVLADPSTPGVECFREVDLPAPSKPADAEAVEDVRTWIIGCP
ncbi:MAG TPA: glycosyltransferase family 39 protein [Candidatus Limnocylindrales bacterium]|nr:glycosyltransferase family 39 protein [Candidatus Limnocylindrales bacterium]